MKLQDIGFYTLSDKRAKESSAVSPMQRCEMILTDKCNFNCPYCRGLRRDCSGDMPYERASFVLDQWIQDGLQNVRFSGGEPTLYPNLLELVHKCRKKMVKRIAISTNGSADYAMYQRLCGMGVNDFSVSLDACCASTGELMAGKHGIYDKVISNIKLLTTISYVTVGVVLTNDNIGTVGNIIELAHSLKVDDIRIIPAAQESLDVSKYSLPLNIELSHPILKYRLDRLEQNKPFRGLSKTDCRTCHLLMDDSVVAGNWHFPCVIYLREGGEPIGRISQNMRQGRINWIKKTNTYKDPICKYNCLDVCVAYNNKVRDYGTFNPNQ